MENEINDEKTETLPPIVGSVHSFLYGNIMIGPNKILSVMIFFLIFFIGFGFRLLCYLTN
jgi:hypothetical protein